MRQKLAKWHLAHMHTLLYLYMYYAIYLSLGRV